MSNRSKAWRRHKNYSKAKRKRSIDLSRYPRWNDAEGIHIYPYYNNLHQYSDNKIHCSCPMCRSKSKDSPTLMDMRRQLSMDDDYLEYFDDID